MAYNQKKKKNLWLWIIGAFAIIYVGLKAFGQWTKVSDWFQKHFGKKPDDVKK